MSDYLLLTLTAVGVLVVILGVLRLRYVSLQSLVLGLMGAIVGLIIGALASVPLMPALAMPSFGLVSRTGVSSG